MTMEIPVLNKYFEDIIEVRDQLSAIPNCLSKSSSKYERKLTFDEHLTIHLTAIWRRFDEHLTTK